MGSRVAVLASGSGSNFQKIAERIVEERERGSSHEVAVLICDQERAYCLERARALSIPSELVVYEKGQREAAEEAIHSALVRYRVDLVVLAGFMRILTPKFVGRWKGRLINIHPSLLPRHPGAHGIRDSYASSDDELGVTVHWVDEGVDTGAVIEQRSFARTPGMTLEEAERRIHDLEYRIYPDVVLRLLNSPKS